ncbi:MAG: deoxyhypusine synthase [Candidatus Hecatellales archaeon]|nr:MAG: deoxyhypusine synthase [Candidatus Hecatellales archaeon]
MTVGELLAEMEGAGFGAGRLARAVEIYEEMVRSGALILLGLAGAMVPAGMKKVIVEMIRRRMVHIIVSTGANMVHDLLEAFGGAHYKGALTVDDRQLYKWQIDRIYDVYVPEEYFKGFFDEPLLKIFGEIVGEIGGETLSSADLLREIGGRVEDENSIVGNAFKYGVPIFVPAIQDSCIGLLLWEAQAKYGQKPPTIDVVKELDQFFSAVKGAEKLGALIVGGGVPKNYIFQAAFELKKPYDYVIQITMDRPEPGGLSGATLEEAVSWGKVGEKARKVQVISDATICLPLLVAAVMERLEG